jgi:hypothetical protein
LRNNIHLNLRFAYSSILYLLFTCGCGCITRTETITTVRAALGARISSGAPLFTPPSVGAARAGSVSNDKPAGGQCGTTQLAARFDSTLLLHPRLALLSACRAPESNQSANHIHSRGRWQLQWFTRTRERGKITETKPPAAASVVEDRNGHHMRRQVW